MSEHFYCVIMAGGVGTRFWPMSRKDHPKQFIDILGTGETLLQSTYHRFRKICPPENIFVVTNKDYEGLVRKQIPEIHPEHILAEPARRNTAPCIAYASHKIAGIDPEAIMVVAPSDHVILREEAFCEHILAGMQATEGKDWLLTLGIQPSRPDTGYGYIQFRESDLAGLDARIHKVVTFTEKPELELAKSFLQSGDFLWNSGIFIWSVRSILDAFSRHLPEVHQFFSQGENLYNTPQEELFITNTYSVCKSISIDYGVMEKAENVYVLSSDFGWSDLGTWGSLYDTREKDAQGNTIVGDNVMIYDSESCLVNVPKNKLVVMQGLRDYIVVEEDDILLICHRNEEQQIRQFVNDVRTEKGEQFI
ncbi:MAG: NTP transferase domain-containing protein [Lentimicrobiaceae bacterium]|nr:NTP transferase domain-containing protein [Lentimicrobiaceae bacterium]